MIVLGVYTMLCDIYFYDVVWCMCLSKFNLLLMIVLESQRAPSLYNMHSTRLKYITVYQAWPSKLCPWPSVIPSFVGCCPTKERSTYTCWHSIPKGVLAIHTCNCIVFMDIHIMSFIFKWHSRSNFSFSDVKWPCRPCNGSPITLPPPPPPLLFSITCFPLIGYATWWRLVGRGSFGVGTPLPIL